MSISMRYAVTNLITSSTLDSVSSEDTLYTMDNLYDKRQSKPFRFTSNSDEWILVDLGADTAVRFVSLLEHDFVSPSVLQIQAYSQATGKPADNGDPADHTETLTLCPENDNIFKRFSASQTYRYWMLSVTDASAPSNMGLGQFMLSPDASAFTRNHNWGFSEKLVINKSTQTTGYGQVWVAHKAMHKEFGLTYQHIADSEIDGEWLTFIMAVKGHVPFVFIPDDSDDKCWYVNMQSDWDMLREFINMTNFSLELREQSRGIAVL